MKSLPKNSHWRGLTTYNHFIVKCNYQNSHQYQESPWNKARTDFRRKSPNSTEGQTKYLRRSFRGFFLPHSRKLKVVRRPGLSAVQRRMVTWKGGCAKCSKWWCIIKILLCKISPEWDRLLFNFSISTKADGKYCRGSFVSVSMLKQIFSGF